MATNGKWQIGFWVLGVVVTLAVPCLAGAIVNNDRLRAVEDQKLQEKISCNKTDIAVIKSDVKKMLYEQSKMDTKIDRLLNR